jgi:hypothetical protein
MRAKEQKMRKFLLLTTLAAAGVVAAGITVQAQTYGPGMMGNDPGYGSHRGYGQGDGMMGPGYGSGYMMGPGYGPGMMGYGSANDSDRQGRDYRGQRQCWKATDSERGYGYHAPCDN